MKQFYYHLIISLLFISNVQAQTTCGYVDALDKLENEFPGAKAQFDKTYMESLDQAKIRAARRNGGTHDTVYIIPVVFHILYNNQAENLEDSIIYSQLEILNEDYRRQNRDTSLTRAEFKSRAADAGVEFVLAKVDPNGNPTSGINRVQTTRSTFYTRQRADLMKYTSTGGADAWDAQKYLNIWVCDYAIPNFGPAILGYAFPPRGARNWNAQTANIPDARQGVMLHYQIVGRYSSRANSTTLKNALGRSATHEVGHFLGLRHVWGDGSNATGCSVDDFIEDTPNARTQNGFSGGCNHGKNTCTESFGDLPDMTENYMDYSKNTCQNMFTKMQVDLMRYNLVNLRKGLTENYRLIEQPEYFAHDYELYPNPFLDELTLRIKDEGAVSFTLVNSIGQLVMEQPVDQGTQTINVSHLSLGMYYFTLYGEDGGVVYQDKLVK